MLRSAPTAPPLPETPAVSSRPAFAFDNSYARALEGAYVAWKPAAAPAPKLLRLNRGLADELGLDPDALASPDQFESVAGAVRGLPPSTAPDLDAMLEQVADAGDPPVHDLRHLFDDTDPVFVDWAHTNERGAAIAAARVYRTLRPTLLEIAGG